MEGQSRGCEYFSFSSLTVGALCYYNARPLRGLSLETSEFLCCFSQNSTVPQVPHAKAEALEALHWAHDWLLNDGVNIYQMITHAV
jgi:hypothetical protein